MNYTTGLWYYTSCKTTFALCIDNSGAKYLSKDDAFRLINEVKKFTKYPYIGKESYIADWNWIVITRKIM